MTRRLHSVFHGALLALVSSVTLLVGCSIKPRERICFAWKPVGDFAVVLIDTAAVKKRLQREGFGPSPRWVVRRNHNGGEVYVVVVEKPFGGLVLGESREQPILGLDGPWVKTSEGRVLTRDPFKNRLLRFCPPLAKRMNVEQDWKELIESMDPPDGSDEQTDASHPPFCLSVDPSGTFFSGLGLNPCSPTGETALLQAETFGSTEGKIAYGRDPLLAGIAITSCNGNAVMARWRGNSEDDDSLLDLVRAGFDESDGEILRAKKVLEVRSSLLRRPVEVADIDPTCAYILIAKPSADSPAAHWYTIEIATGKAIEAGHGSGRGVFVKKDWAYVRCTSTPGP